VKRSKPLRRTPLKAKQAWTPTRKRLQPRSQRRQAEMAVRVPQIISAVADGQRCEAGPVLSAGRVAVRCAGAACDWHEVVTRARGGSILDPANRLWVCRPCHTWITEHPAQAHDLGLVKHSWER
jgi:hypothetical protein